MSVSVPEAPKMVISYRFIRIPKISLPLISHLRIIHESTVPAVQEMVISYRFVRNPENSSAADLASAYNLRVSPSLWRKKW